MTIDFSFTSADGVFLDLSLSGKIPILTATGLSELSITDDITITATATVTWYNRYLGV